MTTIRWGQNGSERVPVARSHQRTGLRGADAGRTQRTRDRRSDGGTDHREYDDSKHDRRKHDDRLDGTFATYTDEEYGYRVSYPANWTVETEPPGGASFGALGASDAGAVVFVDPGIEQLGRYVESFMNDLRADEHVHVFEPAIQHDVQLANDQRGRIIECPYVGETPGETWRLVYLFVVVQDVGYTVGVDWNDDEAFGRVATRIVESFAVEYTD